MSGTPWFLVRKHLRVHWVRTTLTVTIVSVALLLFCILTTFVTSLTAAVDQAASNRIVVQSAVSLFVELPLDYHGKIANVPGVESVCKLQWFGGYYQDEKNSFAQFAIDDEVFLQQYENDLEIIDAPPGDGSLLDRVRTAMRADRRAAIVGEGLADKHGWKIGDPVPLTGKIFPKSDGSAWDFTVVGIYIPKRMNVDDQTMYFRFDYLEETLTQEQDQPIGCGTFFVHVAPGHAIDEVIANIDALFVNGPQKTLTSTEAAFSAGFVSMFGNLPLFFGTIGGAIVFAVLFSVVNTMLLAARQRIREAGVMKALGFTNRTVATLMLVESVSICVIGGLVGTGLAWVLSEGIRGVVSVMFPTFAVAPQTMLISLGMSLTIGLLAGLAPTVMLARLKPVEALRSEG